LNPSGSFHGPFISQDLDELLAISDSLAVINEGRLSPKRAVGDISIDEIGLLMGGVHGEADRGAHVHGTDLRAEASHA
jgi:simple sugar transport system ATP-binding protein